MSLRYILRLIEAFFKRFGPIIVIGVGVGFVFFILLSLVLPNFESTTIKIGVVGRYTANNLPDDIALKLSKGLTEVDQNGSVVPSIAKSWESSEDGKTWTFKIDENAHWVDGNEIYADEIDYKFSDASVEVVDDKTISFKLNSSFSAFPIIVSKPIFKKGLIGTSDWEVKDISISGGYIQKLTLYDSSKNRLVYKFYPSEDRLKLAFKLGEIDYIRNIFDSSDFSSWKSVKVEKEVNFNNFVGLFFNTQSEKLNDKSVRQSIAYAIDKQSFEGPRAISPISPNSWAYNPQVKQYALDLEKAKENTKDLSVTLSTLPNLSKTAEKIKKDLEKVGIKVEIQVVTDMPDDFQLFLATVDIPKDPDQYSLWHSTQAQTNISNFKNDRIDKLLEDGRTELDQEARKKTYLDFQRFLVEDVPCVFLYHPIFYNIVRL